MKSLSRINSSENIQNASITHGLQEYEAMMGNKRLTNLILNNSHLGDPNRKGSSIARIGSSNNFAKTLPPKRSASLVNMKQSSNTKKNPKESPLQYRRPRKSSSVGSLPETFALFGKTCEVITETLLNDMKVLLTDFDLLANVFKTCIGLQEFPYLLFKFFESHRREMVLMRWAIHLEVGQTNDPNELFRADSFATKLFYVLFFAEDGREFLGQLLLPFINDIAEWKTSLEIESHKIVGNKVDSNANCKWYIKKSSEFLRRLNSSLDLCPVLLRESLQILREEINKKFPNADKYLGGIIFLRFICPTLVFPVRFGIVDVADSPKISTDETQRHLIIAGKILQTLANGDEIPPEKSHSDLLNQFVKNDYHLLSDFLAKLLDEKEVDKARTEKEATEIRGISPKRMEEEFCSFLKQQQLLRQDYSIIQFHQKYESFIGQCFDHNDDFKLSIQKKESDIYIYQRKIEGSSAPCFKTIARIPCTIESAVEFLSCNGMNETSIYNTEVKLVEQFDKSHSDWSMVTPATFPITNRDWVYALYSSFEADKDRFVSMSYSIQRVDVPINKKYVRGEIIMSGVVVQEDPLRQGSIIFTYIHHVDPRGSVMTWNSAKDVLREVERVRERLCKS
eukprot:TRINITY_DN407_c0_g1_i1.p1 TRINITY_DN407_c0_g1~~TRINITY_DN407_c0_g1_i1.p1  ORF type:complete len:623 (+),score=200.12 TRINITY_DN407_c0_g1_i1:1814-3682(+)